MQHLEHRLRERQTAPLDGESGEWETREISKALARAGAWGQEAMPPGKEPVIKPWMIDRADDRYAFDVSRARQALGWEPQRSLHETLPKMVAALNVDPAGWYRENQIEPPPELEVKARAA